MRIGKMDYAMNLGKFCIFSLCVAVAGCATTQTERIADRPLKLDFVSEKLNWRSGGVLAVYYKAYQEGDKVSLCGAYTTNTNEGVGGTTFTDLALRSMSISIDDQLITRDLSFLNRLPFPENANYPDGNATCILTEIPWKQKYRASVIPKIDPGRRSFTIRN